MKKMKLSDEYRKLDVEHVEWLQNNYGFMADFLKRHESEESVWASLAPDADAGCLWVGFTDADGNSDFIRDEMLISLSADEFSAVVEEDREEQVRYRDDLDFLKEEIEYASFAGYRII
jgi:hypothetical protein